MSKAANTTAFIKMHGLGNDFVLLDGRAAALALSQSQARALADRRKGIGCDQIIILEPGRPAPGGAKADVFMRIYNADGGEVSACGNATRCVAQLVMNEKKTSHVTITTQSGLLLCERSGGRIAVDMGTPHFGWRDIPLAREMNTEKLELQVGPRSSPLLQGPAAVSVGNPHCIFFVDDVNAYDLGIIGPMVETHPLFPERANVSFAKIETPERIRLRVWERGVGETPACGTAACAVAVMAHKKGLAKRNVTILLDGGALDVVWREDDHIVMTGPAEESFRGLIDLQMLHEDGAVMMAAQTAAKSAAAEKVVS